VLLRKENTPLRDHATLVKRLARSAYSDLPETHRQSYTLTDFMQSLNDVGLYHQLQAKGVTTLEGALQVREDYLRARRLYAEGTEGTRVTTKAVQSFGDEISRMSNLLKQVAKILTNVKTPHRGSEVETSKMATLCGKRSTPRHPRLKCPQSKDCLTSITRRSLRDPASRERSNHGTDTAGCLNRLCETHPPP